MHENILISERINPTFIKWRQPMWNMKQKTQLCKRGAHYEQ